MNSPSLPELWPRVVNGIVVIALLGIAAYVFHQLGDGVKEQSFGAFTTLIGTALAAFFGISATREASRNALDAVNANTDQAKKLQAAQDVLSTPAAAPGHPVVDQLRTILGR